MHRNCFFASKLIYLFKKRVYLFERQGAQRKELENFPFSTGWLSRCPHQPGGTRLQPEARNSIQTSDTGGRDLGTWTHWLLPPSVCVDRMRPQFKALHCEVQVVWPIAPEHLLLNSGFPTSSMRSSAVASCRTVLSCQGHYGVQCWALSMWRQGYLWTVMCYQGSNSQRIPYPDICPSSFMGLPSLQLSL